MEAGDGSGSDSGDSEDSGSSDESGGGTETATEIQSENEAEQSLTHEIGESFTVGDGAQSIEYTVNGAIAIGDYIGADADLGSTPDGTFVVVNLDLENVGDETLDISTNFMKLVDQEIERLRRTPKQAFTMVRGDSPRLRGMKPTIENHTQYCCTLVSVTFE